MTATALPSPTETRCNDAAPPIRTTAAAPTDDLTRIPGRALFWDAGALRLLEGGRIRELVSPYWVRERMSKVTTDRVVAVLGGAQPGDANLWEQTRIGTERLVKMPITLLTTDFPVWSPGAQRVHVTTFGRDEAWIVGLDGSSHRATFPDHAVYTAAWRADDELTVVSAPATNTGWPITDAVLWSWRPPAPPLRFAGPLTLATWPRWSRDGSLLATIESSSPGRAVVVRGVTSRTLITEHDLRFGPGNCVRELSFMALSWSHDARTLAVLGRGNGYFAAFVPIGSNTPPVMFAAPVGETTCYIPAQVEWYAKTAVVPLFGPDCGPTASGSENALGLIDPTGGGSVRYVLTSRKGFLGLSGSWAVATSGEKATEFIALEGEGQRVRVPLWRFADYCCVD